MPADLHALRALAQAEVDLYTCTEPGRPAPGIEHCAACCGGTGIAATCQEEHDLAVAAASLVRAIDALDDAGPCPHDSVDTFVSGAGRRVDVCMGCHLALRFWNADREVSDAG